MMYSEISPPRLSFSHDPSQEEDELHGSRRDTILLDSCSDFEFNICSSSFEQPSSSADELFANGMLLPVMFQQKMNCLQTVNSLPPRPKLEEWKKENMKQTRRVRTDYSEDQKTESKSIWGFKRSSSLNCDKRKSLICSLPLLSRSNSAGSVPNPKRSSSKDVINKQISSSSSSSQKTKSGYNSQKPPLKKNHGSCHSNGVRISPVLNVPPPYISKGTATLFGLGSFLGKDRNGKK